MPPAATLRQSAVSCAVGLAANARNVDGSTPEHRHELAVHPDPGRVHGLRRAARRAAGHLWPRPRQAAWWATPPPRPPAAACFSGATVGSVPTAAGDEAGRRRPGAAGCRRARRAAPRRRPGPCAPCRGCWPLRAGPAGRDDQCSSGQRRRARARAAAGRAGRARARAQELRRGAGIHAPAHAHHQACHCPASRPSGQPLRARAVHRVDRRGPGLKIRLQIYFCRPGHERGTPAASRSSMGSVTGARQVKFRQT